MSSYFHVITALTLTWHCVNFCDEFVTSSLLLFFSLMFKSIICLSAYFVTNV